MLRPDTTIEEIRDRLQSEGDHEASLLIDQLIQQRDEARCAKQAQRTAEDGTQDGIARIRTYVDYPYTSPDTLILNSALVRITAGDLGQLLAARDALAHERDEWRQRAMDRCSEADRLLAKWGDAQEKAMALSRERNVWKEKYTHMVKCERDQRALADFCQRLLIEEREKNLWSAYGTGHVKDDRWSHVFMSDGEWLVSQCGLDPKQGWYDVEEIKAAIPVAARIFLNNVLPETKEGSTKAPDHD